MREPPQNVVNKFKTIVFVENVTFSELEIDENLKIKFLQKKYFICGFKIQKFDNEHVTIITSDIASLIEKMEEALSYLDGPNGDVVLWILCLFRRAPSGQ